MSRKEAFLKTLDQEHETTMRVLRAFPPDQLDLKPSPKSKSARELAFLFVGESGLGMKIWNDELAKGFEPGSKAPEPPESWDELLQMFEQSHQAYRQLIASASEEDFDAQVSFFVAPKTMGKLTRHEWIWFLLHDQIHHRGQFSVYLRIAGAKVPSIYGPTADEPWV
ncbi:MAG TPA: DinB family protein [Thermoanaerobaculia bacterium]